MAARPAKQLSIVVPVYNEGENFPGLWQQITDEIKTPVEVLVVYDFDGDTTVPVVQKYIDEGATNLRLVRNERRGVVGAISSGFNQVAEGPVLVVMADGCDQLSLVDKMFDLYNQGNDVVVGSRYMKGGKIVNGPWLKQGLSRLAGVSLYYLRGIPTHDATNAFKMYDAQMLHEMTIESTQGFEINLELTVKAFRAGRKFAEIPSTWKEREHGTSRFQLRKWMPHYLKWYLYAFRGE